MSDIVLKVNNLWKQYRLGVMGSGTLREDIERFFAKLRGKEDPTKIIGSINTLNKVEGDFVWALQEIDFEVRQGEVLGIIGKNGAGKSTLLKILSKVTAPTKGNIKIKGRVASLLEVGTGFHPELTGRENIFLNGAILGMSKTEIRRKLDEIIDFAGVAKYVDTPVKRYSSGMRVRLGFAVAAFLEPEILIVDEVLAVGDAEFQKKAIGKMQNVSQSEGRTVLFVSHNMNSITTLCSKGIYLKNGTIASMGSATDIVNEYLNKENTTAHKVSLETHSLPGDDIAQLLNARMINADYEDTTFTHLNQMIGVEYEYQIKKKGYEPIPNIHVFTSKYEYVFVGGAPKESVSFEVGIHKAIMWIPANLLNEGTYIIGIALSTLSPVKIHFYAQNLISFNIIEDINKRSNQYNQAIPGVIRPQLDWENCIIKKT